MSWAAVAVSPTGYVRAYGPYRTWVNAQDTLDCLLEDVNPEVAIQVVELERFAGVPEEWREGEEL